VAGTSNVPDVPVPSPPPVPRVGELDMGGTHVDLRARALVAAIVPPPRFGREGEVLAGLAAAQAAGADLADVSLEPRLVGPASRRGALPVVARVNDVAAADAARDAGVALVLVAPELADQVAERGHPQAVVVDDVAGLEAATRAAARHGLPVAIDTSRRAGADALAQEAVAVSSGCRIVRTADVRRARRVVEVVAALVEARRADPGVAPVPPA